MVTSDAGAEGRLRLRPLPKYIYMIISVASFSNFSGYYSLGLITAALLYIPYSFVLSWVTTAFIVTGTLIGGMIGTLSAGSVADKVGRRPSILIGSSFLLAGGIIVTAAPNLWALIFGRFISGIGMGFVTNLSNLLIVELAPNEKRGSFSTIPYFFQFLGTMLPFFVGYLIVLSLPEERINLAWRLMAGSGVVVSLVDLTASAILLPESYRWLLFHNKTLEGLALMEKVYGRDNHPQLVQDYREILSAHSESESSSGGVEVKNKNASWLEIAQTSKYRTPIIIAATLQFIRKFSGNSAVTFYLTLILVEAAGLKRSSALIVSLLIYVPDFFVVFGVFSLLDRFGRKLLLFISCAGLVCAILPMAVVLTVDGPAVGTASLSEHQNFILNYLKGIHVDIVSETATETRIIVIASLFLQRCFYSFGLGPVSIIHTAESLPQPIRAKGLASALFVSWLCAAITTVLFPWALIHLPSGSPYWFFLIIAFIGIPFIFFFIQETAPSIIKNTDPESSQVIHQPTPIQPKPNFVDNNTFEIIKF